MARFLSCAILALLVAGAFAQVRPSPSPSPKPAAKASPAVSPSPAAKPAADEPAAADSRLTPEAMSAVEDAIARARPTLRGRDAPRVLDALQAPLEKVAMAKATGVPVQIAVARSVTDVQQKAPLNAQSRQAVLDAAYRVYTASPAALVDATAPSPSPEPEEMAANATAPDAMNATMPEDMNMTAGNITDADMNMTMTEEPAMDANATAGDMNATEPADADNATAAAAPAGPAPKAPAPAPKSSSSMSFVSSSLLALLAAAVVALV